jgi:hypothetical protein
MFLTKNIGFLMTLPIIILGCTKFSQLNEMHMFFSFYKVLGEQMTQCFASIRTSKLC